jgi:predicted nucleic acid-binding protein
VNYIDTNVIISFISKSDVNHSRALRILDNNEGMVTSPVAILELKSVLSRTTDLGVDEIEAFADYLAEIKIEVPEVDMNKVLNNASDIATRIRMKTLDILHLSASMILDVNGFVTFDHEFLEKKNEIEGIGLKIIH